MKKVLNRNICKNILVLLMLLAVFVNAQRPGNNNQNQQNNQKQKNTVVRFMPHWTNTSAVLLFEGEETIMTAVKNYCGWFEAQVEAPTEGFDILLKQTIGDIYVGAEGVVKGNAPIGAEISLDSVKALSDTLWIHSLEFGTPEVSANYPGTLGDCPVRTLSVMMFDWLHGDLGDGEGTDERPRNGHPSFGVSADFGSGGCSDVKGMVENELGPNGVPVPTNPFPTKCDLTTHLDSWFIPEVLAEVDGKKYTNAVCRDLELTLQDDGLWLGERNKRSPEGGLFFLDDFQYLDEEKTIENPYFDNLRADNGDRHNFGFTMKVQAKFEYIPGQEFEFMGDDDVWVFINNRLVVDLGGKHQELTGTVKLDEVADEIGLVPGETYPFHIFYAERHTVESNFRMRTSMDLHTDASMFLTNDLKGKTVDYHVWQINKKDALSCNFDLNETEIDTISGPSNFRLTGGGLPEEGVELTEGIHYEGIHITSETTFTIDSTAIVENAALAPGHYYLEVSLKANPGQKTGIWITVPFYQVPAVAFANEKWDNLGSEISGDTLQIGKWAYEMYPVNIHFPEDWALVTVYNKVITIKTDNPLVGIFDEEGKPITKVTLDSLTKRATFYIMANGAVENAMLSLKGAATTTAVWANLNFAEPPVPHVELATLFDRNGDGRGDSLHIIFDKDFDAQNILTTLQVEFGELHPEQIIKDFKGRELVLTSGPCSVDAPCGFGNMRYTGAASEVFVGSMTTQITYIEGGREYNFTIRGEPITDGVNPIIVSAVKTMESGNNILTLTFSEAITDSTKKFYADMFEFICIRGGVESAPIKPQTYTSRKANELSLVFVGSSIDQVIPSVGDKVRFVPEVMGSGTAVDLSFNGTHLNNPWVSISGDQEMVLSSPGLVTLNSENEIVKKDTATQPILITNPTMNAKQISDSLGVQGHLVGFDISTLLSDKTKEDIAALDVLLAELMGGESFDTVVVAMSEEEATVNLFSAIRNDQLGGTYGISDTVIIAIMEGDITPENYKSHALLTKEDKEAIQQLIDDSIENSKEVEIFQSAGEFPNVESVFEAILDGTISEKSLKNKGLSSHLIDAIQQGTVTASNLDNFRSGAEAFIDPSEVVLTYKTYYYSHLGHYINGESGTIRCNDDIYKGAPTDTEGNCLQNSGNIYLAWNMRSKEGKLVGTGVYVARLEFKIKIGKEKIQSQMRDFLWGVRRGKSYGMEIDLGL